MPEGAFAVRRVHMVDVDLELLVFYTLAQTVMCCMLPAHTFPPCAEYIYMIRNTQAKLILNYGTPLVVYGHTTVRNTPGLTSHCSEYILHPPPNGLFKSTSTASALVWYTRPDLGTREAVSEKSLQ